MQNLYSQRDAEAAVAHYVGRGVGRDVALRVYTTRLLGREPRLVLHGGGNTSVKTVVPDLLGRDVEVLCVKGSGWDMASIEPEGLPAVRLQPLRDLVALESMTDQDMVNAHRCNLLNSDAPTPSVETLLHAFLPHTFIDHTHANAVLSLTDQPDGLDLCRDVYGERAIVLPYIMPGFQLARSAYEAHRAHPDCEGMILLKHGIFTFGSTAKKAYDRMIDLVSVAESRVASGRRPPAPVTGRPDQVVSAVTVAPILRGLTCLRAASNGSPQTRFVIVHRAGPRILEYVNGAELDRYSQAGVVTPDHAIRTKPRPLILTAPRCGELEAFTEHARSAVSRYVDEYRQYFERHDDGRMPLDPMPRVVLVRSLGLFALGRSATEARITADVAEAAIEVITDAESVGRFESITEAQTFEMEYWSLEQAKLGKAKPAALAGAVAVVTGGTGTIGLATAAAFARHGAQVALLDLDADTVTGRAAELGGIGVACDVTDAGQVRSAFDRVTEAFGGVDIVVSNAGGAWQGRIGEVDDTLLRRSFELNFFAHQSVARAAVATMLAQGMGGVLLFNVSKQAVNPGPDFGPYGLPKAATMALVRQYAVDYGREGIRANGVNADRIRGGMLTDEMVSARARARGVSEAEYLAGNLLHREVSADDVAQAFVDLALAPSTTGAIMTVDGGNIAASLR